MKEENTQTRLYSEIVSDILSTPPKSIFRWGHTLLLMFFIVFFTISYFISYPETVDGESQLITVPHIQSIIVEKKGEIDSILVKNKQIVNSNTNLIIIRDKSKCNIFKSNFKGIVYFPKLWQKKSIVNAGETILNIVPLDIDSILCEIKVSADQINKIKIGQSVKIKIPSLNKPLRGEVCTIYSIPDKNNQFTIGAKLINWEHNDYNIEYQSEIIGSASIKIKDMNLLDRIFNEIINYK